MVYEVKQVDIFAKFVLALAGNMRFENKNKI